MINMKKISILLLLVGISLSITAQTRISVFVTSKVLSEDYQAFLTDQLVEAFTNSNQYIAVNRSNELNELLNQVHAIQDNGYIDPKQIVNATKQYGETQVCGVNVYSVDDQYVFQISLVDIATAQIIKTVSAYTSKDYWGFNSALEIAKELTAKLMGTYENKIVANVKDSSEYYDKELITFEHGGKTYLIHPELGKMKWKNGYNACKDLRVVCHRRVPKSKNLKKNPIQYKTIDLVLDSWRMPTIEEMKAIAEKTTILNKKYHYWTCEQSHETSNTSRICYYYFFYYHNGRWVWDDEGENCLIRVVPICLKSEMSTKK